MVREEEKEKGGESRVKRNTLTCIILREKEAIGILPAVNINFETVRTCAKRNNHQGTNTECLSPMLEVELYIVELIDQLSKMRSPITCRESHHMLRVAHHMPRGTATCKFTSWEKSFARLRTNKKAVAERGWGPLNYNCLLNPEIQLTKFGVRLLNRISHSNRNSITPDQLDLQEGLSGTLTNQIVEYINREDVRNGKNDSAEPARKRKQTAKAAIDTHKRMTAGLHFAVGNTCLGPPLF